MCESTNFYANFKCFFTILGVQPASYRQVKTLVSWKYPSVSWMIPEFLHVPCWLIAAGTHKF